MNVFPIFPSNALIRRNSNKTAAGCGFTNGMGRGPSSTPVMKCRSIQATPVCRFWCMMASTVPHRYKGVLCAKSCAQSWNENMPINVHRNMLKQVVDSIKDDPVKLRAFRYLKPEVVQTSVNSRHLEPIIMVVNDKHDIHHIHERGYVESPVRVSAIIKHLEADEGFVRVKPRSFPDKYVTAVHAAELVTYLRKACETMSEGKSLYPYIFSHSQQNPASQRTFSFGGVLLYRHLYPHQSQCLSGGTPGRRLHLDGGR